MQVVPNQVPREDAGLARADISSSDPSGVALLETKLYVPRGRSGLVPRARLLDRMAAGVDSRLTLVTAPAGSGKTTLVAEWLAAAIGAGQRAGWVSLDASENDPALFWGYFVRALQKAQPGLGARAFMMLHASEPSMEPVLTALINEIHGADVDVVVVLDDYHVIESTAIHAALSFLIDHMPPRMRLVIASRAEPPLPLARLRARGLVTEVHAADLRFTREEAASYLNDVMALGLAAGDVASLERRTEGWITGLKLAALSLGQRAESARSLDGLTGDHRYIADFLVEEVLSLEPVRTREFLLRTSILDRLSGSLCDAVAGSAESKALLESLYRRNLFVVALDDRREWYRYHHLFADVLQAVALREDPAAVSAAHLRASAWYEQNGVYTDAVRHALASGDAVRAAELLEREWPARDRSFAAARWLEHVKRLPGATVAARPVLETAYAWALLNAGEVEAAAPHLDVVERWLAYGERAAATAAGMVVADEARFTTLRAEVAAARVYLAQTLADTAATVDQAQRALDLVADGDEVGRITGTALLALALWANGDLERGFTTFGDALALMRKTGAELDAIRGIFVLGDIRVAQGRLRDAARIYEDGLRIAGEVASGAAETDELYLGLSEVLREQGEIERADELLRKVDESAGRVEYRGNRHRWCTAKAGVLAARGDLAGARQLLIEAAGDHRRDPLPRARPVDAMLARLDLRLGRIPDAESWAAAHAPPERPDYLHEFERITLLRLVHARAAAASAPEAALAQAAEMSERLLSAAEAGGRFGSVIELLVLDALALRLGGKGRRALEPLGRALALAQGEGYVRVFLDEGEPMRELLRQAVARGVEPDYAGRLIAAAEDPSTAEGERAAAGSGQLLTARELAILRLLASGMRSQEVADQLFISPATVKRHIANVYAKLGVGHRTEALVVARDRGLL